MNSITKTVLVCFADATPAYVGIIGKTALAKEKLHRSCRILTGIEQQMGTDLSALPMRWARMLDAVTVQEQQMHRFEYVEGTPVSALLNAPLVRPVGLERIFRQVVRNYIAFCRGLTETQQWPLLSRPLHRIVVELEALPIDPDLRRLLSQAVERAEEKSGRPISFMGTCRRPTSYANGTAAMY